MAINKDEHKKNTRLFLIYFLIFLCIIVVGIYVSQKRKKENVQIIQYGSSAIGCVYFTQNSTRGLWVKYSFNVQNQKFKGVLRTYKKGIEIGQQYEVEYLPSNPDVNRINFEKRLNSKAIGD
ncbi:hypothetical protein [Labilibaculum manganireducens]|uniref:hypothetical protein n=1 Tax=Labilibaculum manganireducens TaxID=1940525 RepID=UPI0029F4951C|nr:hypothetical protein [Labilibaculum manganireducens]